MENHERDHCPQERFRQVGQTEISGQEDGHTSGDVSDIAAQPMHPIEDPAVGSVGGGAEKGAYGLEDCDREGQRSEQLMSALKIRLIDRFCLNIDQFFMTYDSIFSQIVENTNLRQKHQN